MVQGACGQCDFLLKGKEPQAGSSVCMTGSSLGILGSVPVCC